mgnify:CR=1 FL=1
MQSEQMKSFYGSDDYTIYLIPGTETATYANENNISYEDLNTAKPTIQFKEETIDISVGESNRQVEYTIAPQFFNVYNKTWRSSDNDVVSVDNGFITAHKGGNATIYLNVKGTEASCTVAVNTECIHTNTTTHEAIASTCMEQGHAEYITCDNCGKIISGSDELLPLADHSYGDLIARVEPTHTSTTLTDGMEAHYKCSVCGKLFNENKEEVTKEDLVIKAPPHTYGDWVADTEYHWKECGCGNIIEQEEHSGGEATCVNKAICEVCHLEYGEVNTTNHKNTEIRNAKEATCTEEGYTGDKYCTDCNTLLEQGTTIEKTTHTGGEATCINKAVCEICGEEYGELNTTNHKNTEIRNAKEATCAEEGYTGDIYCTDCGKLVKKGEVIPVITSNPEEPTEDETEQTKPEEDDTNIQDSNDKTEEIKPSEEEKETVDTTKPRTGDDSNMILWISLLVISGISLIFITKCSIKRKNGRHQK